jgi:hypothetical protein
VIKIKHTITVALMLALAAFALTGCGAEPATPTPPPPTPTFTAEPPTSTPEPPTATAAPTGESGESGESGDSGQPRASGPAIDLIDKSQEAMKQIQSYHFVMKTEAGEGIAVTAEGDFSRPNSVRLVMNLGDVGNSEMIAIGDEAYYKQPGMESYIPFQGEGNPLAGMTSFTNPDEVTSFANVADSAEVVGDEQIEGADTTHVRFTYDLDRAVRAEAELSGSPTPVEEYGKAMGDMWIDKDTHFMRQIKLVMSPEAMGGATGTTGETTVQITYSRFNEPVNPPIEKPTNITQLPSGIPGMEETPAVETPMP